MNNLESEIQRLERAHQRLVAENPGDFAALAAVSQERALAIESVSEMLDKSEPTPDQLARLNRIHLSGILSLQRIRLARQEVREELTCLSREARVLSGYHAGSITQP